MTIKINDNYNLLKTVSLNDLIAKGACSEGLAYFVRHCHIKKLDMNASVPIDNSILADIGVRYPDWIEWLCTNKYIERRKPRVYACGDIYQHHSGNPNYIVIERDKAETEVFIRCLDISDRRIISVQKSVMDKCERLGTIHDYGIE